MNEGRATLTIGARQGAYPGMPETRAFQVVFVRSGTGAGVDLTAGPDKTVQYSGQIVTRTP